MVNVTVWKQFSCDVTWFNLQQQVHYKGINEADFVNINDCKLVAVLKGQNLIQY